ncbi:MAG: hypothetical protein QM778_03515 [Myxococcales bacterium]
MTTRLAPLMLGGYVLHPLLFQCLVEPALFAVGLGGSAWARIGFGFGATLFTVWCARRTRLHAVL